MRWPGGDSALHQSKCTQEFPRTILARNPHACWCKHMHKLNICLNKEILVSIDILHSFSTWLYMCVWSIYIKAFPPGKHIFSLGPSLTYTSSFTLSPLAVFVGYCQCEAWIDKPPLFVMGGKTQKSGSILRPITNHHIYKLLSGPTAIHYLPV